MSIYNTILEVKKKLFLSNFKSKYPNIEKHPQYPSENKEGFRRIDINIDEDVKLLDWYTIKYMDSKLGIVPELVYVNGKLVDLSYKQAINKVVNDVKKSGKKDIKLDVICIINDRIMTMPDVVIRCFNLI